MSYPCHIHVISVFQKRYIWIYLVYPKLKKMYLVARPIPKAEYLPFVNEFIKASCVCVHTAEFSKNPKIPGFSD